MLSLLRLYNVDVPTNSKGVRNMMFRVREAIRKGEVVPQSDELLQADLNDSELSMFFKQIWDDCNAHADLNPFVHALEELYDKDKNFDYRLLISEDDSNELLGVVFTTDHNRDQARKFGQVVFLDPLAQVCGEGFKGIKFSLVNGNKNLRCGGYGFTKTESQAFQEWGVTAWLEMCPDAQLETIFMDRLLNAEALENYLVEMGPAVAAMRKNLLGDDHGLRDLAKTKVYYDRWHDKALNRPKYVVGMSTQEAARYLNYCALVAFYSFCELNSLCVCVLMLCLCHVVVISRQSRI